MRKGESITRETRSSTVRPTIGPQLAKPIVDAVMKDAVLSNEGITGIAQSLAGMLDAPPKPKDTVTES